MGTSQEDKEKHHARIVAIAAKRVREKGLDGISIADLMKDAGLTHGGFYRHFGSREDLINEAVECALRQWTQRANRDSKPAAKRFQAAVDEYLSTTHRNSPGSGCAVAALSSEAWRGGKRVRQAYTRQVQLYLSLLEGVLEGVADRWLGAILFWRFPRSLAQLPWRDPSTMISSPSTS